MSKPPPNALCANFRAALVFGGGAAGIGGQFPRTRTLADARRQFAAGLIDLGLHFVGEFKLVFQEIINPRANFFALQSATAWE